MPPPELRQRDVPGKAGVDDVTDTDSAPFETYVVMEFAADVPTATIEWVLSKVQAPRLKMGGELLARTVLDQEDKEMIVHVGASTDRLLLAAELMEIKKTYRDGTLREFILDDLQGFRDTDDLDSFLYLSEKQRIVLHELQTIRATETDEHIPGYKSKLYCGEAIIPRLEHKGIITKIFPLHDKEELKKLSHTWFGPSAWVSKQPMNDIRKYFGETIAMYFSFLGFYTVALVPPAFIGVLSHFFPQSTVNLRLFFSIFNLIWTTLFLEAWKRNSASLAYKWGTFGSEPFEEARSAYYGVLGTNKITGRLEPKYPKWKRTMRFYCVSLPVVIACLIFSIIVMRWYFWTEELALAYYTENEGSFKATVVANLPSIVYGVLITIMNLLYRMLARKLNNWENHRLQSAYDNHLITKLVLFDFVNCFVSLFYIAFYLQDMALLKTTLAALLITQQIIGQLVESAIPYAIYKWRKQGIKKSFNKCKESSAKVGGVEGVDDVDDAVCLQALIDSSKDEYELSGLVEGERVTAQGTVEDYLEMFLQFGYVFLFSSVFPSAAFWALLNNITEIRSDAFKLCRIYRRPFSQPTSGIRAWMTAFEIMNVMAVISNCTLIYLSPTVQNYADSYGSFQILLIFVLAEHALLFIKMALAKMIPDEPEWVETAVARVQYQAKVAWRKQKLMDAETKKSRRPSITVTDTDGATHAE